MIASADTTALWFTGGATGFLGLAAGLALGVAWRQVATTRRQAKLDRTVALHLDATTGEVQAAKRRLGTLLWAEGERLAHRREVRYQPHFDEFFPAVKGVGGGALGAYPADIASDPTTTRPLTDLYCVLHSFERLLAAREANALDESLFDSLAWDTCSWSFALDEVREADTAHAVSIHRLAKSAFRRLTCDERQRLRRLTFIDSELTERSGRTPWDALEQQSWRDALRVARKAARAAWKAARAAAPPARDGQS